MQLWEKGLLDFDDEEILKKHCPELMEQKVLQGFDDNGQPNLVERTHPLTVRRLLTHTSGLTYNFLTPHLIGRWQVMHKKGGFLDKNAGVESLTEPLIFQPGTKYAYSIGIDWAGVLVSRISGQTLGEYFDEHIFKPCGVTKLTFFPTDEIKANLMQLCGRDETPERNLIHATGFRSVPDLTPEDIGLHAGGAGLLGTLKDYLTLLRHVLQCKDRDGVIKKSTFPLLFQSAFPPREENGKTHTCYTDLGQILGFLGVDEDQYTSGEHASHSLALCVLEADSKYGRKAGSANWGGIAKTQFWIDPTTGIAVSFVLEPRIRANYDRLCAAPSSWTPSIRRRPCVCGKRTSASCTMCSSRRWYFVCRRFVGSWMHTSEVEARGKTEKHGSREMAEKLVEGDDSESAEALMIVRH